METFEASLHASQSQQGLPWHTNRGRIRPSALVGRACLVLRSYLDSARGFDQPIAVQKFYEIRKPWLHGESAGSGWQEPFVRRERRVQMSIRPAKARMDFEERPELERGAGAHRRRAHFLSGQLVYPNLSVDGPSIHRDQRFQVPRRVLCSWPMVFREADSLLMCDRIGRRPA